MLQKSEACMAIEALSVTWPGRCHGLLGADTLDEIDQAGEIQLLIVVHRQVTAGLAVQVVPALHRFRHPDRRSRRPPQLQ